MNYPKSRKHIRIAFKRLIFYGIWKAKKKRTTSAGTDSGDQHRWKTYFLMSGRIWNSDKNYSKIQRQWEISEAKLLKTENRVLDAFEFLL